MKVEGGREGERKSYLRERKGREKQEKKLEFMNRDVSGRFKKLMLAGCLCSAR